LRDLLDLLILLNFLHDLIVFLGQKCSLTLNDFPNLLLLFLRQADLTLVKQSAHQLAALNLFSQLPLADVKELVILLTYNSMIVTLLSLKLRCAFLLLLLRSSLTRFFLDHAIHSNVHRLGSVRNSARCLSH